MVTPFKNKHVAMAMLFLVAIFCLALIGSTPALAVDTGLEATAGAAGFKTSANPTATINTGIARIISQVIGFIGILFMLLTIYAGFLWMTAQGNEEQIGKAKKMLMGAVIGMVIIFGAYAITSFVISNVITSVS